MQTERDFEPIHAVQSELSCIKLLSCKESGSIEFETREERFITAILQSSTQRLSPRVRNHHQPKDADYTESN